MKSERERQSSNRTQRVTCPRQHNKPSVESDSTMSRISSWTTSLWQAVTEPTQIEQQELLSKANLKI